MRVLLASSEVHPFSKTGGLGDMTGALAKALAHLGFRAGLVTPLYRGVRERYPEIEPFDWQMRLPLGPRAVEARVWKLEWAPELTVYFIDQPEFFDRPGIYNERQLDYPDNADRFIYFSKSIVHLARYLPWQPEVVHVHDWQTGLVPLLVQHQVQADGWGTAPPTCLTIHNLAYQGVFVSGAYELTNLPAAYFQPEGAEFHGALNCLKTGVVFADAITTVSPRYAREIMTEAFGCGLDGVLRQRRTALTGILNGADYAEWNTTHNPFLRHPYSLTHLAGKAAEKLDLQRELGLSPVEGVPLFANVSRLVDQKGSDLLLGALEEMLAADLQFVLLGSGAPNLERAFRALAGRYPGKAAIRIGYDTALSHRIEAAADFFVMPSRFEPCGLNQMYSLRYGTIPIVRATGGLDDSVTDPADDLEGATGIKFREPSARALAKAFRKALTIYADPALLAHFRKNGMARDFSWDRTAGDYLKVYHRITGWTRGQADGVPIRDETR
jgi:starch synthase